MSTTFFAQPCGPVLEEEPLELDEGSPVVSLAPEVEVVPVVGSELPLVVGAVVASPLDEVAGSSLVEASPGGASPQAASAASSAALEIRRGARGSAGGRVRCGIATR